MTEATPPDDLPLPASLQPPMANGEVLFEAPWQGRVFAMAVTLAERGVFDWSEMQAQLIATLGERGENDDTPFEYYDYFSSALSELLSRKGIVPADVLHARIHEFAERPHGHDH